MPMIITITPAALLSQSKVLSLKFYISMTLWKECLTFLKVRNSIVNLTVWRLFSRRMENTAAFQSHTR